ncbi:hypothetical protein [Paenibacillus sedimenti]|uniref:hypothetical protein n=1 Tax=Paenibacillus sedimenti TaxID=2770274 RepID=UPI0035E3DD53
MHAAGRDDRAPLAQRLAEQPYPAQRRAERLRTADTDAAAVALAHRVAYDYTVPAAQLGGCCNLPQHPLWITLRQIEQQRLPRGRCLREPAYLREVRRSFIRWPAFVQAIDVVTRRVRRQLQQHLLLLDQRLARRAPGHRPQPHEVRQAMPRALAQASYDRVDAVIRIAIGVHDGFLLFFSLDHRIANTAHLPYGNGADFDEAKAELGQRLMRCAMRV